MAGKRRRTLVYPHVAASLSEESFVDNSYSNDSSDSGIRDILGIKHIHQMTRNSLLCEGSKSHSILGTVIKAEHQNGGSGDSFVPNVMGDVEKAESIDHSEFGSCHKHNRKKKLKKLTKAEALSDVEETNALDCDELISSHKPKGKKKSRKFRKSEPLSNVEETFADSLECSAMVNSHKRNRMKKLRTFPQSDTLSKVTNWVLEMNSLEHNDTLLLVDTVSSHKSKKKSSKSTKSDTLLSVEETDILDRDTSVGSHKHKRKKKSRKFAQSDTLSDVDETSCVDGSALVNSHKQKEEKTLDTFFQSGNLSDVTDLLQDTDSVTSDSQLLSVPDSVISPKTKKKSRKLARSDMLPDETDLMLEAESLIYNDTQALDDSVKTHKSKTKSRKFTKSDTFSSVEQTEVLDHNASVSSCKHKRKQKYRKFAQFDTLSDMEETSCVDGSALVNARKQKEEMKLDTSFQSGILSDVTRWVLEADSLEYNDTQAAVDSVNSHKSKKKSRKLTKSSTFSDGSDLMQEGSSHKHKKKQRKLTKSDTSDRADLAQEGDILDYSDSQSLIVSVSSPEKKKKPRKLTKSDKSDGTDLVKEADILDFNDSQPLIDSLSSPKGKNEPTILTRSELFSNMEEMDSVDCNVSVSSRKHKGQKRKLIKSDTSAGTGFVQEGDILDYNNSQLLINAVRSPERKKKKPRKLTKSDKSDDTRLVQEADILDYNNSQSLINTVSAPHKSKKRPRKLTTSDTERTDLVQESETLDYNQSQSLISSRRKKKQTNQTKVIQSETLSNKEETDCSDTQSSHVPALVSSHKEKTKKKSSKSPCSETMSDVEEADSLVPEAMSTRKPKRKNKSRTRVQPETSEVIVYSEENDDANSQSQLCVSMNFQPASRKKKSKSDRKLAVRRESNEMVELGEVTRHAVTRGSDSVSDDDIFRVYNNMGSYLAGDEDLVSARVACPTKRCDSITSSINSNMERAWLVKKLQEVTDDDEKFADVLHTYETNISAPRYKNTKRILQEEGLHVNTQNWTISEDQQLKTNWESFQKLYPEVKVEKMLSCNSWEDKTNIQRIIKETDFYVQLGVNIRRYLCQIYKHARVTLIQRQRRPGKEINPMLMELHEKHSNKWSVIAKKIGTTERLVSYRLKSKENTHKKGFWSAKEDECLIGAVSNTVGDRYMELDKSKFYWPKIAEGVPGRDAEQCYSHWFCVIHPRLKRGLDGVSHGVRKRQTYRFSNKQLIDSIESSIIDGTCHINWTKVRELMDRSLPITVFQHRWQLLVRNIPDHGKTFTEIIEHLRQLGAETHMTKPTPGRGKDTSTSSIHSDDDEHRIPDLSEIS